MKFRADLHAWLEAERQAEIAERECQVLLDKTSTNDPPPMMMQATATRLRTVADRLLLSLLAAAEESERAEASK